MAYKKNLIKRNKENELKMEYFVLFCFKCTEVVMMVPVSIRNIFYQHIAEKEDCYNIRIIAKSIKFSSETNRHSTNIEMQHILKHIGKIDFADNEQIICHRIEL